MRFIEATIFAVIGALGALIALAIAKPIPDRKASGVAIPLTRYTLNPDETIDLRDAISSHGKSVEERILTGLDNYEMNTGTMHPYAIKQNESRLETRGANIPLTTYQNIMWSAAISIGTPPKTLKVQIDTGAANMWVLQTGCSGVSRDHDLWDPHSSESAKYQGKLLPLTYASGLAVTGDQYADNVTIGGFTADPQIFGSVTSYNSQLPQTGNADGLLGLAFPSLARFGADPLFESLTKQNALINPTFSLKLSSYGAEMYVGGANSMLYNGDIAYTPVTSPGYWQVSMDDVRVNDNIILEKIPAIIDTGANYIFGDWKQVSELYGRIGGKVEEYKGYGFYYLPCDSFPAMSFTFGGETFELPPEALRLKPIAQGSPNCFSAIVARRAPYAFWSIGIIFLQGVYTVFDYGTLQVGFAELD